MIKMTGQLVGTFYDTVDFIILKLCKTSLETASSFSSAAESEVFELLLPTVNAT